MTRTIFRPRHVPSGGLPPLNTIKPSLRIVVLLWRRWMSLPPWTALPLALLLSAVLSTSPAYSQSPGAVRPGFTNGGSLPHEDDDFRPVTIPLSVNFFGVTYTSLFIGDNGYVTFGSGKVQYTPEGLKNNPNRIIAPFFADVDTTNPSSGVVTYGTGTVNGRNAFGVNWVNVGYFSSNVDKLNSFQLILIDRSDTGTGNFDIEFNYDRILWEAGDVNGGVNGICAPGCDAPAVGYSNGLSGSANVSFEFPGSHIAGAFLNSNRSTGLIYQTAGGSGVAGRLLFPVRNGVVVVAAITSLTPPSATAGGPTFNLTIAGTNFTSGSTVRWTSPSGQNTILTPTSVTATQVVVSVSSTLIAAAGNAQVTVVSPSGASSNSVVFPITAVVVPTITSLTPPSATAGGPTFNLTIAGTNFTSGSTVRWTSPSGQNTTLTPTSITATQVVVSVSSTLIAAAGNAQVTVVSPSGASSNSVVFPIASGLTLTSVNPNSAQATGQPVNITLVGTGFVSGATARWTFGGQTTNLQNVSFGSATQLTATIQGSLLSAPGTAQITVANPTGNPSNAVNFTITPPAPTPLSLNLAAQPSAPTDQPSLVLTLSASAPSAMTGSLVITFVPNAADVPTTYIDPNLKFAASGTTTLNFTVAAGATAVSLPNSGQFSQGTVAGTITVTVRTLLAGSNSVLPNPPPSVSFAVNRIAPMITAGSVKILSVTATGFTVEVQGYSTTRDLTNVAYTFSPASGAQLSGTTTFQVPVGSVASSTWFNTNNGRNAGSMFSLQMPFTFTGDTSAIGTVSVTLSNSIGTSTAVSGGQ